MLFRSFLAVLEPGYAVASVLKDQRRNVRSKKRHVTLNDINCAVMADVLGATVASKPEPRTAWGKVRRTINKYLPNPMGFFMCVPRLVPCLVWFRPTYSPTVQTD